MPDKPSVPAMTGMICRYMLTMGGVVMLTVAAYFGLQGMISSHELAVMAKNQVERQMVLSQRSALLTQQLIHVDDPDARTDLRRQLAVAAGQLETAHTQLVRDLFGHKGITEPDYDVIAKMYFQDPSRLEDQVNGFVRDIRTLIATSDDQLSEDDPSAARVLLAARGRLLDGLNTVVYQIELDHRKKTKAFELQDSYVLAAIILVIVLEGIFIFIPLIMRIRREFDRLGKIQEELDTAQQQEKIAN
ncbi:MAG: hypothetical protein OEY85_08480, partial [Rhodospirillales bacterium]|nr:hypothetical protein [Rhodospirillales bacterium]